MTKTQKILVSALAVLLAATALAWWKSAPLVAGSAAGGRPADTGIGDVVDEGSLATAQRLALLASGAQEQGLAQSALRIADHELDLALTSALVRLEAHPPAVSAAAAQIEARLQKSQRLYEADQARVADLTALLARASAHERDSLQEELDLVRSQTELDQYEIEEAGQDLLEAGGNLRQRIEKLVQQHAAAVNARVSAPPAAAAIAGAKGLVHELQLLLGLRDKAARLESAQAGANELGASLAGWRRDLAAQLEADKASVAGLANHSKQARDSAPGAVSAAETAQAPRSHEDAATLIGQTRLIATDQRVLGLIDQRILDQRELAGVYGEWKAAVGTQLRASLHRLLSGVAIVFGVLLVLLFLDRWLVRLLGSAHLDRRQVETLRSVTRVALQILAVLIILFIVIGVPDQFGTVLGIVGAGLTVALKDFIVAFIGWFVLMGRNGIRLGDWVEINGVSGEVIELGMFHTVLLETGNWSDAGHPTGRRVTFTNSFAIEGHYFNFSTSGQWLWDELQVVVPAGKDPYPIVDAIGKKVREATAAGAAQAEQEWQRAVPTQAGRAFSGAPGINIKPVVGGVEIAIRYLTRANERFLLRASLYQAAVDLLGAANT